MTQIELRPPGHQVERRAMGWWATQALLAMLAPILILGLLALLVAPARLWLLLPAGIIGIVGVAVILIMPQWRYRVHRWETTDDAVYTRSGWVMQTWRVAPLSRIQTVDTVRGPLQQAFRLSTVTVTTASAAGPVKIDGLDHEFARDLVEQLTKVTQAVPGDAT
ncbi:PH domain-containing protein [Kibdelosporangium philippinense]|uniref:PH domain-containing protein n=1 Tax=Kibdelosporangium philippinense TaxID=211113 RepID=A0ABS8ZBD2_9PSEU|nr:PH domain-containing protein [Kibdelosporangium philippinense]MCE7004717.1 PH domain-containing protein [Kibdelosporangium philippinense]